MTQQRTIVDEAAELAEAMSPSQVADLLMRIPGMTSRVFKERVRFTYYAPRQVVRTKPAPIRRRRSYHDGDDPFIRL